MDTNWKPINEPYIQTHSYTDLLTIATGPHLGRNEREKKHTIPMLM